jgi:hypothetical protein
MAGLDRCDIDGGEDRRSEALEPQLDLSGNFKDLESLLDQLGAPPVFELGKPLPNEKFMPRRAGSCPAAHNRALLDD